LRETIKEIHKDIKLGKEGNQVYGPHSKVFGAFATTMLSIASTSGNMAEMYENTAKYLERDFEFKKSMKSALFMPAVVFFFIILTFLFYIMYIFPQTTNMLLKYNIEVPPMTAASMALSDFLIANIVWVLLAVFAPIIGFVLFVRSEKGRVIFHKKMIKIPVIGSLLHKSSIEIFARVINAMYSGAGDNIGAIKTAAEACRNSYIESKVKTVVIPTMLREGRTLTDSLVLTGVFPVNAINRLRAGEETGTIKESARQLADYYEREVSYKMTGVVDWIQLNIAIVVTILIIVITLISSELGFVSPDSLVTK
jgi:type IV pilus assembly protein PilC